MIRNPYPDIRLLGEEAGRGPSHLWLEATSRCNTRCKPCPHYYRTFGEDMAEEVVRKIEAGVLDGVKSVDLIGCGEPFIARHWEALFQLCSEKQIKIEITTNGKRLLADPELVHKIVRTDLVLALSCDGARKETYEFVRPYIRWEETLQALEALRRAAREAGREKRFSLRINFVAMRQNIADLPGMVRLAQKYDATTLYVMQLAFGEHWPALEGQSLHDEPELVRPAMLKALWLGFLSGVHVSVPHRFREHLLAAGGDGSRVAARLKRGLLLGFLGLCALRAKGAKRLAEILCFGFGPRSKVSKTYCASPWQDAFISANGVVNPCCMDHPLGDLNTQSWQEIWNGAPYRNLRRTIHSWNPSAVCRFCEHSKGLNGGDGHQYNRYFARFRSEAVRVEELPAGEGLSVPEFLPDGAFSHRWTERRCRFSLKMPRQAAFLRLRILPLAPVPRINSGFCTINGGPAEPFDNSCEHLHFPLDQVRGDTIDVQIELERDFRVGVDVRALGMAIRGIDFLLRN